MRYRGAPSLTAVQQLVNLKVNPISKGAGWVRLGKLTWQFTAQPDPLSRAYSVLIEYQQGKVPQVYILDPDLGALADGQKLPHVYQQSPPQLCLYLPGTGEWSPSKRISDTIVPWTFLWLWYFEEWLASSVWKGGGLHPSPGSGAHRRQSGRLRLSAPNSQSEDSHSLHSRS
jgi:hypothetical protein